MNRAKIKFSSVTHALNAKSIIEKNGGRVTIGKSTNPKNNEGCGYFIIAFGDIDKYIKILKINNIKLIGYDYL